jgi:hypothetical protein
MLAATFNMPAENENPRMNWTKLPVAIAIAATLGFLAQFPVAPQGNEAVYVAAQCLAKRLDDPNMAAATGTLYRQYDSALNRLGAYIRKRKMGQRLAAVRSMTPRMVSEAESQ